jgi:stage II sporulation protein D
MSIKPLLHVAFSAAAQTLLLLAAAFTLAGCPKPPKVDTAIPQVALPKLAGVPTIRVLVAAGPEHRVGLTGAYRILADGREVARSGRALADCELARQGDAWRLGGSSFVADTLTLEGISSPAGPPARVRVDGTTYRGKLCLHADPQRTALAVNHVDLETYLAGVLAAELYHNWHFTTYQALAVAARTYAIYEMSTVGRGRWYDLHNDQSSQVYRGYSGETEKSWRAVRQTAGQVLACGPAGAEKVFRAHYSASCGGTVNNVYVLYGQPAGGPLVGGQRCDDCRDCPKYRWPAVAIPKDVVYRAVSAAYPVFSGAGGCRTVEVVQELYDRPVWVDVVGRNGAKCRVRAQDLRLALLRDGDSRARSIYSMNCRVRDEGDSIVFEDGRGFGHGVGLCQWGAQRKAQQGRSYTQILAFYYPSARLCRLY